MRNKCQEGMTYNHEMYEMDLPGPSRPRDESEETGRKKRNYTKRGQKECKGKCSYEPSAKRMRLDKKWAESENVDIDDIVNRILLSVPSEQKSSYTVFSLSEWETAEHIIHMLFKECPSLTKTKMDFNIHMSHLYDKIMYN